MTVNVQALGRSMARRFRDVGAPGQAGAEVLVATVDLDPLLRECARPWERRWVEDGVAPRGRDDLQGRSYLEWIDGGRFSGLLWLDWGSEEYGVALDLVRLPGGYNYVVGGGDWDPYDAFRAAWYGFAAIRGPYSVSRIRRAFPEVLQKLDFVSAWGGDPEHIAVIDHGPLPVDVASEGIRRRCGEAAQGRPGYSWLSASFEL